MPANVEWSAFNAAVREHAARETAKFYGLPQPKPELAPAPSSFVPVAALIAQDTSGQFLRRASCHHVAGAARRPGREDAHRLVRISLRANIVNNE